MHPSPSAETCGPFFPNFRCSIFPLVCVAYRFSALDVRYGPQSKKAILLADDLAESRSRIPREVLTTSLSGRSLALLPPIFHAIIFRQGEPPGSPAHLEAPSNTTC